MPTAGDGRSDMLGWTGVAGTPAAFGDLHGWATQPPWHVATLICAVPVSDGHHGVRSAHGGGREPSGSAVFTPIRSRYRTIQISAIADGMVMKASIFWAKSGTRNAASMSTR
jgi:hypothetical protein